jgi:hypothetical protein
MVLARLTRCAYSVILLSALAGMVAGCADSRLAANNAAPTTGTGGQASTATSQLRPQSSAPQGVYGIGGGGYNKTIFEALGNDDDAPAPVQQAQVQPGQVQPGQVQPGQPAGAVKPGQPATAAVPGQTVVAANTPPQPPAAKPPPDTLGAYGIPSRGMSGNLFDTLFGN